MNGHPPYGLLVRYAEDELAAERATEVEEHLHACDRCRSEVDFVVEVGRRLHELRLPRPPAGLFEEVERRRAAGERRILPLAAAGLEPRRDGRAARSLIAVLAIGAATAVTLLVGSRQATADASTLRFSTSALGSGTPIAVEFRAASRLAGEERVRLRGRYRTADMGPPRETLGEPFSAVLVRGRRASFRGALQLPATAVHARFTVESLDGRILETDGGRPWELWARDERGRPTFASLRQAMWVAHNEAPVEALALARRATELYPDHPEGWHWRVALEGWLTADDKSQETFHRERLRELEHQIGRKERPTPEELAGLLVYARSLREPEAVTRALRRLEAQNPAHPRAVQERVAGWIRASRGKPDSLLRLLEEEWRRFEPGAELLAQQGFVTATTVRDPDAAGTWAERYQRWFPGGPGGVRWIARSLASFPELRTRAMDMLRDELRRLEETVDERRPLVRTMSEQRRADEAHVGHLLALLGELSLETGRSEAARDTLMLAAGAFLWDLELFQNVGRLLLIAGDTAEAVRLHALQRADPFFEPREDDPLSLLFERQPAGARERSLREAEKELRRRVLAEDPGNPPTMLPQPLHVADGSGNPANLASLLQDRVTVLVDWNPILSFDRHAATLDSLETLLEGTPVQLLTVMREPMSPPQVEALDRLGLRTPRFADAHKELAAALRFGGLCRFLVVDGERRVSDHGADFMAAARHALLLSEAGAIN